MIDTLIIGGGGIKGFCFLGALDELNNYHDLKKIDKMIGSSVGAIIVLLLSLGYTPSQIFKVLLNYDFKEFSLDINEETIDNIINHFGFTDTDKILKVLNVFISKKCDSDITFKEHYNKYHIELTIVGSNISKKSSIYYNKTNTPNYRIIDAIKCSICIPFIFKYCKYDKDIIVDGAISNAYPIDYYEDNLENCIGLFISENYVDTRLHDLIKKKDEEVCFNVYGECLFEYFKSTINTLLVYTSSLILKLYSKYTILINNTDINMIDFYIEKDTKNKLFIKGKEAFMEYYKNNKKRFNIINK